jgi:signal transduction histidine kinase
MKRAWTLRWRIATWSALVSALALLTFTVVVARNLYAEQVEMIDVRLETVARVLIAENTGARGLAPQALAMFGASRRFKFEAPVHGFVLTRTRDGSVVQAQPAALAKALVPGPGLKKRFSRTIDGARLRIGTFAAGENTLLLAASLEPAEESVLDLLGAALIAIPAVLLVVAGGSWWIARRALAPIAAITRAASLITADRLGERLPAPDTADEIGHHTEVLNGMFDRLQRSFEQATRFTADAAHELRTPLTIMRGQIEEALRSDRVSPEQESLLVDLLEESSGLQKIADTLLLLARFDAGRNALQREAVDVSALLVEMVEDAGLLAAPKGIKVTAALAPALRVDGDPVMLRRLALNLIDNAVKFNVPGGGVSLALHADADGRVTMVIGNTGPGLPSERRAALFERFYRSAGSRNRESGGSGLGLSLCREIAVAHGGEIALTRGEADWTEFTVRLPRLP